MTRRRLITAGLAGAGVTGLGVAAGLARRYGLVPPDHGGIYGPGHTLTYASQRLLTRNSMAREFSRGQISTPFANSTAPRNEAFARLEAGRFADWQLEIDGMVARPASLSLAELRELPARSQITMLTCEEGWSFIAEWTGARLADLLERAGALPQARYVVYHSMEAGWWDSVDMADALHPQTLVTYGMNGGSLPVGHGGPVRLRAPRHLGYKSVKWITRLTVTDDLKRFGAGLGSAGPEAGYQWHAGI
jgi:DMSO/TMAO reductase YedYZ molybdopterin-dependent catalytic subunit